MNLAAFLKRACREIPSSSIPSRYDPEADPQRRRALWEADLAARAKEGFVSQESASGCALATYLPWDSHFFGKSFYRLEMLWADSDGECLRLVPALEEALRKAGADYVFGIMPPAAKRVPHPLSQADWDLIENRQTYRRGDLAGFKPHRRYAVRSAAAGDIGALEQVAIRAVNPHDRFRGDSFYSAEQVDALMAEWIRVSVEGTFADAVLISDTQPPHAFVTLRLQKTNWKTLGIAAADISLIAVDPRYPGWFPRLASEALLFGRSRGAEAITVTTQAGNKGVIRTLEGLEFHRVQSEEVFRKIL